MRRRLFRAKTNSASSQAKAYRVAHGFSKDLVRGAIAAAALGLTAIAGCSSKPIIPEAKNVKVMRENPRASCREIGPVQGSVITVKGTIEQAIEDMRLDAARKGANYVRMETASAIGTSVMGTAFDCP